MTAEEYMAQLSGVVAAGVVVGGIILIALYKIAAGLWGLLELVVLAIVRRRRPPEEAPGVAL